MLTRERPVLNGVFAGQGISRGLTSAAGTCWRWLPRRGIRRSERVHREGETPSLHTRESLEQGRNVQICLALPSGLPLLRSDLRADGDPIFVQLWISGCRGNVKSILAGRYELAGIFRLNPGMDSGTGPARALRGPHGSPAAPLRRPCGALAGAARVSPPRRRVAGCGCATTAR
jgi:hypothetical protein